MRLHSYAASANGLKVRALLGLLNVPYELVEFDIFAGDTLSDGFAVRNPLRETPVLELDDGTNLTQSNAIIGYLAEARRERAARRVERAQVAAWLFFQQERIVRGIGGVRFRLVTGRATAQQLEARIGAGAVALDLVQAHLRKRQWLVGEAPTIADLSVWSYVHLAADAGFDLRDWPDVADWSARGAALPGLLDDIVPYPPSDSVFSTRIVAHALQIDENPLTQREVEVLRAAADGRSTEDIGAVLLLSPATVRNYLSNAMSKLGARNRIDAIRLARDAGWL
jgi:glutathione S-transferase